MDSTGPVPAEEGSEAENRIGEAEAWATVEASPDGMLVADELGTILYVNLEIEKLFGIDRSEIVSRKVETLLPERFREVHRAHRTRYRASPASRSMGSRMDLWGRRWDGSEFPVEVSLSPVETESGRRIVATVRDISERHEAEADRLAVLRALDAASDGVFIFDAKTLNFSYVNEGAVRQLGYSRQELLGMTPLHIKPSFTEASFREWLEPLLNGEDDRAVFTTYHRCRDGTDLPVEVDLEVAPGAPGQPTMLIAIARDLSERLLHEAAEAERAVSMHLTAERERLAADLHDLVIQRIFGAGMGLQAVVDLIDSPTASSRVQQTILELDHAIAELRASIFELATNPGNGLLSTIEAVIAKSAERLGFRPSLEVVGDLNTVGSEVGTHLVPALTEVLSNVARHAHASSVDVRLTVTAESVELMVEDDGVGVGQSPRGNGLNNLERRARQLEGSCSIAASAYGRGTRVSWMAKMVSDSELGDPEDV